MAYDYKGIEKKWQKYWLKNKTFKAEIDHSKPKQYILDMFPYPSGAGLHVGHPEGYTATDIISRYKRMNGVNVLHCMGWDAFGLPAEQAAVKTGMHPKMTTEKNIANFKRQIIELGFSYDWDREINTTDKEYYRWTQWIFLQIFNKGLAYQADAPVNWCPELRAVLANEEIVDGKSEIGGHPVYKKKMRQWLMKITDYADRLLDDLEDLDWPESIKQMQRNWIGKSHGALLFFPIDGEKEKISVFTTRPDTVYGATFCVLAPEHALVEQITSPENKKSVEEYIKICSQKSELERTSETKNKTGIFTGGHAINPLSSEKIPIWIADYVIASYGTGAIMCVPAHDQRDHDFAKKFNLKILPVVHKTEHDYQKTALTADGKIINSPLINGLEVEEAKKKIIAHVKEKKLGEGKIIYKLRDWLFSRQRYWGEPIPILLDNDLHPVAVDESELPLELPVVDDYKPAETGESPLSKTGNWLNVSKGNETYTRETNTMPQWAGSCWYYLRFTDAHNSERAWSEEAEKYWMPVDLYVGGAEHAVLHLLYARFWHKVLYDLGHVTTKEPFQRLINQGIILGTDGQKMAKSAGNGVNPDDVIKSHGADSLRLYEMFMGPLEKSKPWQTNGIDGCFRFLNRAWNMIADENGRLLTSITDTTPDEESLIRIHFLTKEVTEDIEKIKLNTAISGMMTFVNFYTAYPERNRDILKTFVLLLSPFSPHIAEELWELLGGNGTLAYEDWPKYEPSYLKVTEIIIPVQINGKLRDQITISKDTSEHDVFELVFKREKIQKYMENKTLVKKIYVTEKIINIVVK